MTSSATTRNRLEKQGTGDNANTWGTYLNSSIDLIDAALDGRTAFSLSGSKTLTSANYAADESRERFLDITGGTGGTVTIPAVEKWYIVRNASSGDVVFTTGSGVTQTVKSGSVSLLVSDGTNIRAGVDKGYVDNAIAQAVFSAVLPEQTGNAGKYITTDGIEASWGALAAVANSGAYADLTGVPTALSAFTNDSGFITTAGARSAISATGSLSYDSATGVFSYTAPTLATVATTGAYSDLTGKPAFATVATTGAYSDLTGKPAFATVATTGAYSDLTGKPAFATVATTGAYSDLTGKPTLPSGAIVGTTDTQTLTNKTLTDPKISLGGTNGASGQALVSQGAGVAPAWATIVVGFSNIAVFTSSGTWTVPSGVTKAKVTVVGGGGGGMSGSASASGASGNAGGAAIKIVTTVPGGSATITVGSGGTATAGSNGSNGGNSSFVHNSQTVTGSGGGGARNLMSGASVGSGTGGDVNINGGWGSESGTYTSALIPSPGGASIFGANGASRVGPSGTSRQNTNYGGGGGGGPQNSSSGYELGGAGGNGIVIIEY